MTGAEYIAQFLKQNGLNKVFLMTGGACAFIIDAIARTEGMDYFCFQHEQAAAMAADAIWRISGKMGVSLATSGPGATNLLTGIACSYFDSIPSFHITGQVNTLESAGFLHAKVRQAGFQETDIVSMAKPITKYAVRVTSAKELITELPKAFSIAIEGRPGPVLIDVPMNVQQEEIDHDIILPTISHIPTGVSPDYLSSKLASFFKEAQRPVILFGAGLGLAGVGEDVAAWIEKSGIPFVSSWNGQTYFSHDLVTYCGNIGVYGNRGANYILQNSDALLVLGSRLDNRQRSGNSQTFAPKAKVLVVDIDTEELKKYHQNNYDTVSFNLKYILPILHTIHPSPLSSKWSAFVNRIKKTYFRKNKSSFAEKNNSLSPYEVIERFQQIIADDAIVIGDTGACVCWLFQAFHRTNHTLFTAGGMSPMGYALPSAIGAALFQTTRRVISFNGDGGFQVNLQELQTVAYYHLDIKIIIMNNYGYGIIKQFQDSYCNSRYEATGNGYSAPNFAKVAEAYGIPYRSIHTITDINAEDFDFKGPMIIEVHLHPNTLIEPKLEMRKAIHEQFPYLSSEETKGALEFL